MEALQATAVHLEMSTINLKPLDDNGSSSRARRAISEFTDSGACMVPSSELVENRILQKLHEFLEVETP